MKSKIYITILILILLQVTIEAQSISRTNFSGVIGSGARAFGMGGAFIAVADDATAASWNPGGLGQLERPEFSFVLRDQKYGTLYPAMQSEHIFYGPQDFSGGSFAFDFASFTYPKFAVLIVAYGDYTFPLLADGTCIALLVRTRFSTFNSGFSSLKYHSEQLPPFRNSTASW